MSKYDCIVLFIHFVIDSKMFYTSIDKDRSQVLEFLESGVKLTEKDTFLVPKHSIAHWESVADHLPRSGQVRQRRRQWADSIIAAAVVEVVVLSVSRPSYLILPLTNVRLLPGNSLLSLLPSFAREGC